MSENEASKPIANDPNLRDANLAAEERPVPSQAEGDLETVEEDIAEKDQAKAKLASSGKNT